MNIEWSTSKTLFASSYLTGSFMETNIFTLSSFWATLFYFIVVHPNFGQYISNRLLLNYLQSQKVFIISSFELEAVIKCRVKMLEDRPIKTFHFSPQLSVETDKFKLLLMNDTEEVEKRLPHLPNVLAWVLFDPGASVIYYYSEIRHSDWMPRVTWLVLTN